MNILALQGSPRADGNTATVLEVVLEAARQEGAATEAVYLCGLDSLTGCLECTRCQQNLDEPGCAVPDDMIPILGKALKAQVLVFATPVFCWSLAWPLKMALDRFYCMFKPQDGPEVRSLLTGRKMAAVITAGGGELDGADLVAETCRRMTHFSKCHWIGDFVATYVSDTKTLRADQELLDRARRFGRKLAS